jgi:YNFM family putative membrane transporter
MDAVVTADLSRPTLGSWRGTSSRRMAAVIVAGICTFITANPTQALLPHFRRVYHATELQVSLTVSATMLAVVLSGPIVGLLAETIGRKRVIVPALFGLVIPTILAATSTSLTVLIFWRFAQGLFIPGIATVMMAYINEEWPASGVGSAMASYVSGTVLGGFLGRFIAGMVTAHCDWRWSFVVLGLVTLTGAVVVRRWLPPSGNFVRSQGVVATLHNAAQHFGNLRLVATFGMGFAMLFALHGTFTYVNFYLAEPPFGLNSAQLGSVFTVYLLGLVVTPLAGWYMDRQGFRKTIVMAVLLSLAGLALTLKLSLAIVIGGLALLSSGIFVLQAAATTNLGRVAGQARSSAAGLYVTFYYLGGSLGPVLPAYFWVRGGWPATVALLATTISSTVALGFVASRKQAPNATLRSEQCVSGKQPENGPTMKFMRFK